MSIAKMFYLCPFFFSCNCNDPSNSLATPLAKIASKLSWDSQVGNHGERARLAKPPIPRENALKPCNFPHCARGVPAAPAIPRACVQKH
jgi:hypothetical protein